MKLLQFYLLPASLYFLMLFQQAPEATHSIEKEKIEKAGLFDNDSVLQLTIRGNIREIMRDRSDDAKYHPISLSYTLDDKEVSVPLKCKTRGNFRRDKSNCTYPPILLNFQKLNCVNTIFEGQDKVKLVMPCRDDEYVVREYLVYKLYNVITEKSFKARLVNVHLYDSVKSRETDSFYGMLLEEDEQMAKRNGMKILEKKMLRPENIESEIFLKMAVFEYLIGNTDWSLPFLHNTRIIAFDSASIPSVVPYDFDHAGIVEAPYAFPPEELHLSSTKERRYRGNCLPDLNEFKDVVDFYNRKKNEIYAVYAQCPFISAKYLKSTNRFLDQFYETINDPRKLKADFGYPCLNSNITIKGLEN